MQAILLQQIVGTYAAVVKVRNVEYHVGYIFFKNQICQLWEIYVPQEFLPFPSFLREIYCIAGAFDPQCYWFACLGLKYLQHWMWSKYALLCRDVSVHSDNSVLGPAIPWKEKWVEEATCGGGDCEAALTHCIAAATPLVSFMRGNVGNKYFVIKICSVFGFY